MADVIKDVYDINPNWNQPPAYMGYVGFVRLVAGTIYPDDDSSGTVVATTHGDYIIRATTADINMTQEVTKPDVVDSRYDRTVYQLGPRLVDGSVAFPVLYEIPDNETISLFETLYRYAVTRDNKGLLNPFSLDVKYAASATKPSNFAEFTYLGCVINTWQFSVSQSDVVTCNFDIIGVSREPYGGRFDPPNPDMDPPQRSDALCTGGSSQGEGAIGTTRVVTWNDARVEFRFGTDNNTVVGGQFVRSFEANINNDAERFYSLNAKLFAQAIAPRKRDVTGNVVLIGRHPDLAERGLLNQENCTEDSEVRFGFDASPTGQGCENSEGTSAAFDVLLPNCVFEIETMSLTNDIFESTINWHSLPSAGTGVCDPLLTNINTGVVFDIDKPVEDL